jgi:RHH-type proline utilization regulon transcriptional repressor/proline dehydrogenase/delta 1-pyrroline-5-carboxylate dehydrogenase
MDNTAWKFEVEETPGMNVVNQKTIELGKDIFAKINRHKPSILNKKFWSATMMEWSMKNPELKVNMFRFVDVLPTLRSSSSVAKHLTEYLSPVTKNMGALFHWATSVSPYSPRAFLTTVGAKFGVGQMATQFIAGRDPQSAEEPLKNLRRQKIAFTADLLGEYCLSEKEAEAYLERYMEALSVLGKRIHHWPESKPIISGHPGDATPLCISVKLTALYSQCGPLNVEKSVEVLSERLSRIVRKAKEVSASIYVDAEDSGNNEIIYKTYKNVFGSPEFRNFPYPGIVVQAYSTAANGIIDDLLEFSRRRGTPIAVRLVKGAYWDHETISCEQNNWPCPLFKNKESSDANYEAMTRKLIDNHKLIFPAFASHNIRSLSHACMYAEEAGLSPKNFELQMLFGMADPICFAFRDRGYLIRQYVPLGEMLPGMGYLIRRLLENTSNESFLRHTFFDQDKIEDLLKEPQMKD